MPLTHRASSVLMFCLILFGWTLGALDWPEDVGEVWSARQIGNLSSLADTQDRAQVEGGSLDGLPAFYLRPVAAAGEERSGLPDRDVTLDLVGVDPASRQLNAQGPLPPAAPEPEERIGYATYYHPSLHGGIMADSGIYNRWDAHIAASNDYPLGTVLLLTYTKSITVAVRDRGLLSYGQVDLSEAAFAALAPLSVGVIDVTVQEVE